MIFPIGNLYDDAWTLSCAGERKRGSDEGVICIYDTAVMSSTGEAQPTHTLKVWSLDLVHQGQI